MTKHLESLTLVQPMRYPRFGHISPADVAETAAAADAAAAAVGGSGAAAAGAAAAVDAAAEFQTHSPDVLA